MPALDHLLARLVQCLVLCATVSAYKARAGPSYEVIRARLEPRWLSQCAKPLRSDACCRAWEAKVKRHFNLLAETYSAASKYHFVHLEALNKTTESYDIFEPTWNCESLERVPWQFGDGPKLVCGVDVLGARRSCLVYSVGSNGHVDFEKGIKSRAPNCEIHTWDPYLNARELKILHAAQADGTLTYHDAGLIGDDGVALLPKGRDSRKVIPSKNFTAFVDDLGHRARTIDILKVDIEGGEFTAFAHTGLLGKCLEGGAPTVPIRQVHLEIHGVEPLPIFQLFEMFFDCGYALVSKEPNHWGCKGVECGEFSLVSPEHAWDEFVLTHPSCAAAA